MINLVDNLSDKKFRLSDVVLTEQILFPNYALDSIFRSVKINEKKIETKQVPKKKHGLYLRSATQLMSEPLTSNWLVKGLLPADTFALIYAQPAVGKSVLALEMATAVALGCDFYGRKVAKGTVVYLTGEGQAGISKRLKALQKAKSLELKDAPFFISNTTELIDTEHGLLTTINTIDGLKKVPSLIVLDTLARCFNGDENSTEDMNKFIRSCDILRNRYPNSTVLVIHHSGLSEKYRSRGSSALISAVDVCYLLNNDKNDLRILHCDKFKDDRPPEDQYFSLEEVVLDEFDESGDCVTSVVFQSVGENDFSKPLDIKLNRGEKIVMHLLLANCEPFDIKKLQDSFLEAYGESADTSRKAFTRAVKKLESENLISKNGDSIIAIPDKAIEFKELQHLASRFVTKH